MAVAFVAGLQFLTLQSVAAADLIVRLRDGRQWQGSDVVRPADRPEVIGLRMERPGIVATRWFPVAEVQAVLRDGVALTAYEVPSDQGDRPDERVDPFKPDVPLDGQRPTAPPNVVPYENGPVGTGREERGAGPLMPVELLPVPVVVAEPVLTAVEFCVPPELLDAMPTRAVVVGVRADPLSAYGAGEARFFPEGIPPSERGFARDVLRERKAFEVLNGVEPEALIPVETLGPEFEGVPEALPLPQTLPHSRRPAALTPPVRFTRPSSRVAWIDASAVPVAPGGRADWTALLVDLRAFDAFGEPVAIGRNGVVSCTLMGQRQRVVRAYADRVFYESGATTRIGGWTFALDSLTTVAAANAGGSATQVNVATVARGPGGDPAAYRCLLPLSRFPEHDQRLSPFAELLVELTIPGQGVFETAVPEVPLAHLSPTRERRLVESGTRFYSRERTTAGRRVFSSGVPFFRSSVSGPDSSVFPIQP